MDFREATIILSKIQNPCEWKANLRLPELFNTIIKSINISHHYKPSFQKILIN